MPLTLEQYAVYLDTRRDLTWPPPPEIERPKVRPHLSRQTGLQAILWNVYGTLLAIQGGDLLFEHPTPFVMNLALERTIQEFKMWGAMSRKPGQPSEYMSQIYKQVLLEQRAVPGAGARQPIEVGADRLWEAILKRLLQKDYRFDAGAYGSLNEFSRKVAYFFHCCLQGYSAYEGAAATLRAVRERELPQGLAADGQCFTLVQLHRALTAENSGAAAEGLFGDDLVMLSHEARFRSTSEKLYRPVLNRLAEKKIKPHNVLYITSRLPALATAKRLGLRTALFAGDRASLEATSEQIKGPATRPDLLLSELQQINEVL